MDKDIINIRREDYATVSEFMEASISKKAVHTIHGEQLPLEIYTDLVAGKPLLISFHGAVPEDVTPTPPFFSGRDLAAGLSASLVAFSDPCLRLHPELRIGWFAGTKRLKLQALVPKLIRALIRYSRPSKLIFLGGSAGGFAALYYSREFPGARCLAWNPQTNLRAFDPRPFETYCRLAFDLTTNEEIEHQLGTFITYDLTTSKVPLARTLYLQNVSDDHVNRHLRPLLAGLGSEIDVTRSFYGAVSDRLWLWLNDWGTGHTPPPRSVIRDCLHKVTGSDGSGSSQNWESSHPSSW